MRSLIALHGQEVEKEEWQCSTCFYIFIFSGTPSHGIVPPYLVWDFATSVKAPWKHPHRHAQTFVSQVILNPVNLTINYTSHELRMLLFLLEMLAEMNKNVIV